MKKNINSIIDMPSIILRYILLFLPANYILRFFSSCKLLYKKMKIITSITSKNRTINDVVDLTGASYEHDRVSLHTGEIIPYTRILKILPYAMPYYKYNKTIEYLCVKVCLDISKFESIYKSMPKLIYLYSTDINLFNAELHDNINFNNITLKTNTITMENVKGKYLIHFKKIIAKNIHITTKCLSTDELVLYYDKSENYKYLRFNKINTKKIVFVGFIKINTFDNKPLKRVCTEFIECSDVFCKFYKN